MKVFKYLIKPLEYLVLLGAIAALVYFRSVVFHSNVNKHLDTALAYAEGVLDVEIPFHKGNADKIAPPVIKECEPVVVIDKTEDDAVIDAELTEAPVADVAALPDEQAVVAEIPSQPVTVIDEKADSSLDADQVLPVLETASVVEEVVVETPLPVVQDNNSVNQTETVVDEASDATQADFKTLLIKARQSFWNGKVTESEKIYLGLSALDNHDPSVYGELGNVYYAQGKWKQAGEAYYEAAIRLLEQENNGQVADQVNYLLRVIQGLDTESAEKLKSKIAG